ncbi:MAG: STAS domain-containing protein [Planctomycetes bacterium]|nr:STAS domain-containing protein [Planctomycetota bacterium]
MVARDELYATATIGPALVVVLKPKHLLDIVSVERMGTGLKELIDRSLGMPVVLDFSRVSHLSSAALGLLISIQRRFARQDGRLMLAGFSSDLLEVFRITRLDRIFDIRKTARDAVAALDKES